MSATLAVSLAPRYSASMTLTAPDGNTLDMELVPDTALQVSLVAAVRGAQGPKGDAADTAISETAENRLTLAGDGGLYVPELVSDPLAYYILAKN